MFGLKLGLISSLLAGLAFLWYRFRDMFISHQIAQDENKIAQTDVAIAIQSDKITQDEEKLNEVLSNYDKSKSSNDPGQSN
jgi:DNA polymerase IIIc chi subunit